MKLLIFALIIIILLSGCSEPISKTLFEEIYSRECIEYLFNIELSDYPCEYACKKLCYEKSLEFNKAYSSSIKAKGIKSDAEIEIEGYNCGCSCLKCKD